jgi:protein phosphatase 2C family protein 2/3
MMFLVVAILGGHTEEWHSWITDCVKGNYGYETPTAHPQIYAENSLRSFKVQLEMWEAQAAKEAKEGQAARVERQASETLKLNIQESYEEMGRARTPTIPDSDDSTCGLTPKLSAISINQ